MVGSLGLPWASACACLVRPEGACPWGAVDRACACAGVGVSCALGAYLAWGGPSFEVACLGVADPSPEAASSLEGSSAPAARAENCRWF